MSMPSSNLIPRRSWLQSLSVAVGGLFAPTPTRTATSAPMLRRAVPPAVRCYCPRPRGSQRTNTLPRFQQHRPPQPTNTPPLAPPPRPRPLHHAHPPPPPPAALRIPTGDRRPHGDDD